jgi:hypothetical protein
MRVRRFLHLILLLGVCGLVWQVWLTWSHSRPPIVTNAPSSLNTHMPTISQAGPGTGKKLSRTITAKNLFSPDRRTPKEEAPKQEEKPPVPPPKHLKLVGVFLANGHQEAFFADASKGGKVVRVPTGGTLESYQLTRLTHAEAVLTLGQGGEEVSLQIAVQKSPDAAKASRRTSAKPKRLAEPVGGRPGGQAPPQAPPAYQSVLGAGTPQAAATTTLTASGQDEAVSIRQNIRQLQRRLRDIRRDRARERRAARAEADD